MSKINYIGGKPFEVVKSKYTDGMVKAHLHNFACRDLYDFYARPSDIKMGIYMDWWEWYFESDCVAKFEVTSGSTFTFTIRALYIDPDTQEVLGVIIITKDHNKLYLYK